MAALAALPAPTRRRAASRPAPAPVLQLNGMAFAHVRSKVDSRPAPLSGLYDVCRGGVLLMEHDSTVFALACGNGDRGDAWSGPGFFVSASRLESGKMWFAFSTTEQTERRLGIHGQSHADARKAARSLLDQARAVATRWQPR